MQQPTQPQRRPLSEVAAAEARRLAADPNVLSVGFGLKFVNGRPTLEAVLQYYVLTKVSSAAQLRRLKTEVAKGNCRW